MALPHATHTWRASLKFPATTIFLDSSQAITPSKVVPQLFAGPVGVAQAKPSKLYCTVLHAG